MDIQLLQDVAALASGLVFLLWAFAHIYVAATPTKKDDVWLDKVVRHIPIFTWGDRAKYVNGKGRVPINVLIHEARTVGKKAKTLKEYMEKKHK